MQQHIYYIRYALQWAYHDKALMDEFQHRGIDTTAVYDGKAICYAHPVRYDIIDNLLAIVGWDSLSILGLHPCRLLLARVEYIHFPYLSLSSLSNSFAFVAKRFQVDSLVSTKNGRV